ncbi:uncharacterized protein LOC141610859 [Silene latifolia]|uniref:uncharacterized protein LOC141610859 n=1 Tax=Silene latifolia TaxID=37657 RepID=UPI003D76AA97
MASPDDIASLRVEMDNLAAALEGWSLKLAARGEIEYSKLPWQKCSTTLDAQQVFDKIPEPNGIVQSDSQLLNHNLHVVECNLPNAQSQSAQKVLDELPIPTFILEMAQATKTAELDSTRSDYEPESDTGVLTPNRQVLMCTSCAMEKPLYNSGRDEELEGIDDSDSQDEDEEEGTMQFSLYSQEKKDDEMHVNTSTEGGSSLQEDVCHVSPSLSRPEPGTSDSQTPSLSTTKKDITRTLLSPNGGNNATKEGTSRNNITELVPRASTSSTIATAKFEGFDIRIDSVSTLEKIWRKHGNIVEKSVMRNRDIIAMCLESLATMVRILDETSAMSLSDREVDYLVSTLSDLRHNRFKVDWLIPSVEKAEQFHTSRPLMESFNNLSQLCSDAKDRRAKLLEQLTKLDEEVNNWKEEMAKILNMIPSCGQVKFDEPIGSGLT